MNRLAKLWACNKKSFIKIIKNTKCNLGCTLSIEKSIVLLAICEFLEVSPSSIVEEVVFKFMNMITSHDDKLRSFWENEIRAYLDMFLKAA